MWEWQWWQGLGRPPEWTHAHRWARRWAPWFLVFRRTFICSLSNDLEIPQLLRFAVVSFPPLPISPSLLIDVILLSIQISHHFPHPRTEQNSKSSQVPHPIQLLPFPLLQCVARHRKTATTVFSLLIVSRSHYIQVSSPPRNLWPLVKGTSDLIAYSPGHL